MVRGILLVLLAPGAAHEALAKDQHQNLRLALDQVAVDHQGNLHKVAAPVQEEAAKMLDTGCGDGATLAGCKDAAKHALDKVDQELDTKTEAIEHLDMAAAELATIAHNANEGGEVSSVDLPKIPKQVETQTLSYGKPADTETSWQLRQQAKQMIKHGDRCDASNRLSCEPMAGSDYSDIRDINNAACAAVFDLDGNEVFDKQGDQVHECQGCESDCEDGAGIVDPGEASCGRAACKQCPACWCMFPSAIDGDDRLTCTSMDTHYLKGPAKEMGKKHGGEHGLRVGERCHPRCKEGYHLRSAGWPDQYDGTRSSNVYMSCAPPKASTGSRLQIGSLSPDGFQCDPDPCDFTVPEHASDRFKNACHGHVHAAKTGIVTMTDEDICEPDCETGFHVVWQQYEDADEARTDGHLFKLQCRKGFVHVIDADTGTLQNMEPNMRTFKCEED